MLHKCDLMSNLSRIKCFLNLSTHIICHIRILLIGSRSCLTKRYFVLHLLNIIIQ